MTLALRAAARTDVGLRRDNNEDAMFVGRRLVAIADGMGGQAFGEVASRVVIHTIARVDEQVGPDLLSELRDAIADANEQLRAMIAGDDELDGMGTTFTALLAAGGRLALAHVGDSRAYLLRAGELRQITHDHSLVQGLVDAGQITAEDAATHPSRAVITKALDGHGDVEADLGMLEAQPGDRFLLCSDGLSDVVSDDTLAEALQVPDRDAACERLIELALRAGGPDNITVVVADVVDDELDRSPAAMVIGGSAGDDSDTDDDSGHLDIASVRAAELSQRREGQPPRSGVARGPGRRVAFVLLGAIVVAGLAVLGVFLYTRSQYYVGQAGAPATVAVFRGVPGGIAGIDLSKLASATDIPVSALPEDDKDKVRNGITAGSSGSADSIVRTLRSDGCSNYLQSLPPRTVRHRTRSGKIRTLRVKPPQPAWCRQ